MDRIEKAVSIFNKGFSCSQAVFAAYAPDYGVDFETAMKLSTPFGGGIAGMGEICGAVSGAIMVIGLKYGRVKEEELDEKTKTYELTSYFIEKFKVNNKSHLCAELIDIDPKLGEEERSKLKKEICTKAVTDAARILEEIL